MKKHFFNIKLISIACLLLFNACEKDDTIQPEEEKPTINRIPIEDEDFSKQWYLQNTGQNGGKAGVDVNVIPVWNKGFYGKDMTVGIIDDGVDLNHTELKDNLIAPQIFNNTTCGFHGTNVAGIVIAKADKMGIRGIAPMAKAYVYNLISELNQTTATNINSILTQPEHTSISVYNNSYGPPLTGLHYSHLTPEFAKVFDAIAANGFNGLGSNIVFAAGNIFPGGSPSNNRFLNHYSTIGVNTIDKTGQLPQFGILASASFTIGTNLWISAPSNDLYTTTCNNEYSNTFGATSGAAPMVTGAIALLREAYPKLTWRDVKLILAESARKNVGSQMAYKESGVKYSNPNAKQTYSHETGFGMLNITTAFDLAKNWIPLPAVQESTHVFSNTFQLAEGNHFSESTIEVSQSTINFTEFISLKINFVANNPSNADSINILGSKIYLVSPDGTEARFYDSSTDDSSNLFGGIIIKKEQNTLTLLSNAFLGNKKLNGKWKLKIKQPNLMISEISSWELTIRGH